MQYFGVPRCPYCKKRVNLIRTWSLKRQGEYRCPRCGGISNIFLSPLVYVFALLAVFAGGAIYFFHRFVLDDVDLFTCLQVAVPFAVFFLLSLFMVYLAKPVIKRVSPEDKKGRGRRRPRPEEGRSFSDSGEYQPRLADPLPAPVEVSRPRAPEARGQQAPRPASRPAQEMRGPQMKPQPAASPEGTSQKAPAQRPARRPAPRQTAPVSRPAAQEGIKKAAPQPEAKPSPASKPEAPVSRPAAQEGAKKAAPQPEVRPAPGSKLEAPVSRPAVQAGVKRPAPQPEARPAPAPQPEAPVSRPAAQEGAKKAAPQPEAKPAPAPQPAAAPLEEAPRRERVSRSVEVPSLTEDFFAKYNDPEYVNRRLKELHEEQQRQREQGNP